MPEVAVLGFDLPGDRGQGRPWIPLDADDLGEDSDGVAVMIRTYGTNGIEPGVGEGTAVAMTMTKFMSPPWPFSSSRSEPVATLSSAERREFGKLDETVALGVKASKVVMAAGAALARIRDGQLFRDSAPSWEGYLEGHGLSRRRADQLIHAARIIEGVEEIMVAEGMTVPALDTITESSARQLAGLDQRSAAAAVSEAAASADGLTPATLRAAASKRKPSKRKGIPRPISLKVPGGTITITFNGKGVKAGVTAEALVEAALGQLRSMMSEAA
jgi:hypothetical protein